MDGHRIFTQTPDTVSPGVNSRPKVSSDEGLAVCDPFAIQNVTLSDLEEPWPDSGFQSTSAPDLFDFTPDEETYSWAISNPADEGPCSSDVPYLPMEFPNSQDTLIEPKEAFDTPGFFAVASKAQERENEVENPVPLPSLPRRRSRYNIQKFGQKTEARSIPIHTQTHDPLQRWRESPPED